MGGDAKGPAAEEQGPRLSRSVAVGRHAGAHSSCPLRRLPRASRAGSQPNGGDHRQPERSGGAKRGASIDPQGYDAGKKVTGRKRHIMVDTLGLMVGITVHAANVQDRDGAAELLRRTRRSFPFIEVIFADAGYQGPIMAETVASTGKWRLAIGRRDDVPRFEVVPHA